MSGLLQRASDLWRRFHGRGTYPHEMAFLLRLPLRELVFSRRQLLERLQLRADAVVLEIGPGPGYFSPSVARAVPAGRLELLDLQPEMLAIARRHVRCAGCENVHFTCGAGDRVPYRSGTFDVAFAVAVLGEVPDPAACVHEVARVLRPGGTLSITELPGDPDALSQAEVLALCEPVGFHQRDVLPLRGGYSLTLSLGAERDSSGET